MLIISLTVLTMLVILGLAFASLMRLESRATINFRNGRIAEMVAESGESAAVAMLRSGLMWDAFTQFTEERSPWLYGIKSPDQRLQHGGLMPLETTPADQVSLAGTISQTGSRVERYKVKIIDTAAQININGPEAATARLLDNLAIALQRDPRYVRNPLQVKTGVLRGQDLMIYRRKIGGRFSSKGELKNILGQQNYDLIADFITAHSWVDQNVSQFAEVQIPDDADGSAPVTASQLNQTQVSLVRAAPQLLLTPKSPININTAPEPVLVACLMGLAGRRPFLYTQRAVNNFGSDSAIAGVAVNSNATEAIEETSLLQEPVWVFTPRIEYDVARRIAQRIIQQRKASPFRVWRSRGQTDTLGFEDFIDSLDDSIFPPPESCVVIYPRNPDVQPNPTARVFQSTEWIRGHINQAERQRVGLSRSGRNAFYYDAIRAVIKANANPNARINRFNPNEPVYIACDKSDIVNFNRQNRSEEGASTTEFCFDSPGVFEVTTFAEVVSVEGGQDRLTGVEAERTENILATAKRRSVIQVWETLRHTTQQHFEEPFESRGVTNISDRQGVMTFPDPIGALQEDCYFGSRIDGRVEIAGRFDVGRPGTPVQLNQGGGAATFGHTFRFREPRSRGQLCRLRQVGGLDLRNELNKALDADFSAQGGPFSTHYSAFNWNLAAVPSGEPQEAQVTTASLSNLQPDGIFTSLLRNGPESTGCLRFPALTPRRSFQDVGASGLGAVQGGNVPYYAGEVEFWVKFEQDPRFENFCGLFAATQVRTDVGQNPEDSEGSQFFVYKNTQGYLRVTRMYYHQAFPELGGGGGGGSGDGGAGVQPIPPFTPGDPNQNNINVDPMKALARYDTFVPLGGQGGGALNWGPHEWHHIRIRYDDRIIQNQIQVELDGNGFETFRFAEQGPTDFVVLNQARPRDEMYVGAFFRRQFRSQSGVFKFQTNSFNLQESLSILKYLSANATIDEVRIREGSGGTGALRSYYTDIQATYANVFEVPIPDGMNRVRLRTFTWTIYPPGLYSGQATQYNENSVTAEVLNVGQAGQATLSDPGGDFNQSRAFAGRWLNATETAFGTRADMVYRFQMRGTPGGAAVAGGRFVASPVLDDVTLTYYLPSTRHLVSESLQ